MSEELERAERRAARERRARLAAEEIAERATRELYDTVRDLREAEAQARIVGETAAEVFSGPLEIQATLAAIAASAKRALGARRATCYAYAADGTTVEGVHTTEEDPGRRVVLEERRDRPVTALPGWRALVARDGAFLEEPGRPGGALLGVRLAHASIRGSEGDADLGMLLIRFDGLRDFTAADRLAARSLGALASMALANARLHEQTLQSLAEAERRAATDPLTGLANHRAFHERLSAEVRRAQRYGRPLALVLVDLDHFKRVNDSHGHQVGDRVLVEAGRILAAEARDEDLVARMGGEEFAWLMPETDGAAAWQAAERARAAIGGTAFADVGRVTISAGVCGLAQAGDGARLYALADGALYWAKHHGRDVVVPYSAEVVEVLSAEERATRLERRQSLQSIRVLALAVDAKDPLTRLHSDRVAGVAVGLATALGWPSGRIARLHEAAIVHDVGKIGVPDAILLKAGPLTDGDYGAMKAHAALGGDIVTDVLEPEQVAWVRGHHERWGGGGYPDGLAGEDIPDGARVIAVADAWDVMTSERPYRDPVALEDALEECRRCSGEQFDPEVVEALERLHAAGALEPRAATGTAAG